MSVLKIIFDFCPLVEKRICGWIYPKFHDIITQNLKIEKFNLRGHGKGHIQFGCHGIIITTSSHLTEMLVCY